MMRADGLKGHVGLQHQLKRQGHLPHRVLMTVDGFREMVWVDYSHTVGGALEEFRGGSGADREFRPRVRSRPLALYPGRSRPRVRSQVRSRPLALSPGRSGL